MRMRCGALAKWTHNNFACIYRTMRAGRFFTAANVLVHLCHCSSR